MKTCEYCMEDHDGSYGSGRFCSNKCARGFSTSADRHAINKKVSDKLSIRLNGMTKQQKVHRDIAEKHASYVRETELTSILQLSTRTVSKILKRMKLACSLCSWRVEGVSCDVHHIKERKNGGSDDNTNLTYVCPNCHRLIHNNLIDKKTLINLYDYIGDEWKKFYFVKDKRIHKLTA